MITPVCSRWRDQRGSYRPAGEVVNTRLLEVSEIPDDTTAREFVLQHHYSASYPSARRRFGLHRRGELVGVAVFSHPVQEAVLDAVPCGERLEKVELGRFVLLDEVEANAETWFLARTFEALRRDGFVGVVSFSDPMARVDAAGKVVHGGHVGCVYQAANAVYTGRGTARTLCVLPSGKVVNERRLQKIRALERGWEPAVEELVAAGAAPLLGDPAAWLREQLPRITRRLRHPGNHRYVWGLQRASSRVVRALPALPYPKLGKVPQQLDLLGGRRLREG
jgi:hypothetical protein